MEKSIFRNKKAIAKLFVIAIVVMATVGGVVGVYYLTLPTANTTPSTSPTPQNTANPTQNPTPASSPTQSQTNNNFKVGAYANYNLINYLVDPTGTTTTIKLNVSGEESYSGTSCWVYTMTTESDAYGVSSKMVTTRWLSKSTLECLHIRVQSYINGNMVDDQEYAGDSNEGSEMPKVVEATLGTETITVAAGTFNNCVKDEQGTTTGIGSKEWVSVDVPIWGLVKLETYSNGLMSVYELTGYGK